ncbi:MAG TPA: type II toxin-antitoxin system YafQ family toxin [Salinimicrobium sp.]|nr:type II toxin-antitoxin system YafQ family toxin [Salinimicrobium sp.]
MYKIRIAPKFKKDLKKVQKRPKDFALTEKIVERLREKGVKGLPAILKPHKLKGNYKDHLEAHIKPDLLIIWIQIESPKKITLVRIGTHSELF